MHDFEKVNEFLCLNSHVKFSSNKVEVAWHFICHIKYWSATDACILSTSNQMIFLLQFGINKHSLIFPKLQTALAQELSLKNLCIFCSLKFTCAYLFQIALKIIWLPILINNWWGRTPKQLHVSPFLCTMSNWVFAMTSCLKNSQHFKTLNIYAKTKKNEHV